ncbi:MAG: tyrosine-type recombinase/integrase [Rubrobacteraceae bacterium]
MSEAETKVSSVGEVSKELHLGDAIHFFLSAKRAGGRSERTLDDYRKKLELFQRFIAARVGGETAVDAPYIDIGADEIEAYAVHLRDGRGMADSSRKNHLAVLRSFFLTVSKRMKLPDPASDLDEVRFHSAAPKRSYLTKREAGILFSAIESQATNLSITEAESGDVRGSRRRVLAGALAARDHAAFSVMVYAGLRIEEATSLAVEDVSFVRGGEEVRVARGKGNKERVVPMAPKLGRSLKKYLKVRGDLAPPGEAPPFLFLNDKGLRVTENTLRRRLYSWVRRSGISKQQIKPHDLRRTFGTWFLQANPGHVRELAELMGHPDLSQVMKYALSDEKRARAGIAKL